jgi:hypothetical protein
MSRGGFFVLGIFLAIGLAIMGGSVYSGWRTAEKVEAVASWPTAPAYIIESRIEWAVKVHDRGGASRRSYSYGYGLPVLAGYRVGGEFFTSSTPGIMPIEDRKFLDRDPWKNPPDPEIVALFKRVPQGTVVPIHYNPANAGEAYFFAQLPFWNLYGTNVAFFVVGMLSALFGLIPMLLLVGRSGSARRRSRAYY